jgi:hypothetical protein
MRMFVTATTGFTGSAIGRGSCAAPKATRPPSEPGIGAGGVPPAGGRLGRPSQTSASQDGREMPTTAQLAVPPLSERETRCEALFASRLQPSDAPTADMVAEAINCTVRRLGVRGCARRMAQEFGDYPDAAATRMRWARQLAPAAARPHASPGARP